MQDAKGNDKPTISQQKSLKSNVTNTKSRWKDKAQRKKSFFVENLIEGAASAESQVECFVEWEWLFELDSGKSRICFGCMQDSSLDCICQCDLLSSHLKVQYVRIGRPLNSYSNK